MPGYLNVTLRAIMAYIILLILTRIMGKREISQMTFFDYVVGITIGSVAANMTLNNTRSFATMLPAMLVFAIFQIISSYFALKNRSFRKLVEGKSTMLIKDGKVLDKNLTKERLNIDDLAAKLRDKNVFSLADVEFAFLETDGKISVMKKSNKQPVTPSDLKIPTSYSGLGDFVVIEGEIKGDNLREQGLTRSWLLSKLASQGVYNISKVMLAQVDGTGNLYVDLYDEYQNEVKKDNSDQITLAKLMKIQSDFYAYYNEVEDEELKKLYKDCGYKIERVANKFDSYIKDKEKKNTILGKTQLN